MQAIGELDQDDADIARHRHHHLAEVFGLLFGFAAELNLRELGHAFDQIGHLRTKLFDQLLFGNTTVFDDIVHQRRHQALRIESKGGENAGDRYRMGNVGFAGSAVLAFVGITGQHIGFADLLDLLGIEIGRDLLTQALEELHRAYARGLFEAEIRGFLDRRRHNLGLLHQALFFLLDEFGVDQALLDFTQRDHGRLVIVPLDFRVLAAGGELAGALGRQQHQVKTVAAFLNCILDGDTCHA